MKTLFLLCAILLFIGGCKSGTEAGKNNFFTADISYNDSTATHYVSDDFNIHFNRVQGAIDTLIITADRGEDEWIYAAFFTEIDSLHKGDYQVNTAASYDHKGAYISYFNPKESPAIYGPSTTNSGTITITDIDIANGAIKGTFHCTLYENDIANGKKVDLTSGTFSWNY